eukprot:628429_1
MVKGSGGYSAYMENVGYYDDYSHYNNYVYDYDDNDNVYNINDKSFYTQQNHKSHMTHKTRKANHYDTAYENQNGPYQGDETRGYADHSPHSEALSLNDWIVANPDTLMSIAFIGLFLVMCVVFVSGSVFVCFKRKQTKSKSSKYLAVDSYADDTDSTVILGQNTM